MGRIAELPLAQAAIQFRKKMASVESKFAETGKAHVRTTDGEEHVFDEVVVTCPLGWLKAHKEAVKPLAPRLSQAN
jgi:hypothetical protein